LNNEKEPSIYREMRRTCVVKIGVSSKNKRVHGERYVLKMEAHELRKSHALDRSGVGIREKHMDYVLKKKLSGG
jgi:hypothetical protein